MINPSKLVILAASMLLPACGDNIGVQQISGRVNAESFPQPITGVAVVKAGVVISESPVDATGAFSVYAPTGYGYRVQFVSATTPVAKLVFPRQAGTIDDSFNVHRAMGPVDLGAVEFVGDPATTTFVFSCTDGTSASGMCVDDDGDGQGGADEMEGDNNQCGDNQDAGDNEDDGDNNQAGDDGDADLDTESAVGDNNIESDVGCHGDDEEGDDEGDDHED